MISRNVRNQDWESCPFTRGVFLPNEASMARETRLTAELDVLRALCGRRGSHEKRVELACALDSYRFIEPEHQVVFASIRAIHTRPEFSASLLAVHLNNRGFPDLELEKYFVDEPPSFENGLARARQLSSPAI
jgi:hypothetical protein